MNESEASGKAQHTMLYNKPHMCRDVLVWSQAFPILACLPNSVFHICNPLWLNLITRLLLGLSHLNKDRLNHSFNICINPLSTCSWEDFFLHCNNYNSSRTFLLSQLNDVISVDRILLKLSDLLLVNVLLCSRFQFVYSQNAFTLNLCVKCTVYKVLKDLAPSYFKRS